MVSRDKGFTEIEKAARIEGLKARKERTQEALQKAGRVLFQAKEERDNLLLALYALDHQIELLAEGQIPLFGEIEDDE